MSIIYDALQKTQQNRAKTRDVRIKVNKVWTPPSAPSAPPYQIDKRLANPSFLDQYLKVMAHRKQATEPLQTIQLSSPICLPHKSIWIKISASFIVIGAILSGLMFVIEWFSMQKPAEPEVKKYPAVVAFPLLKHPVKAIKIVPYNTPLVLNGVFLSAKNKIAEINNKFYHLGDVVEGMRIISIKIDYVVLQDAYHTLVLNAN